MNRFIKRVVKHIDKFPLSDRYNIEKIYGIGKRRISTTIGVRKVFNR